jgi:uncharacterized linocin/CFP29 family protein
MLRQFTMDGLGAVPPQIAHTLLHEGLSVASLRAMSPLPEDAQRIIDRTVIEVGLDRLTITQDLISRGLTWNLPNPLSVMEIQWEVTGRSGFAQRTMNPAARGEFQLPPRENRRVPVYLTTDDFSLGIRTLLASRRVGTPLDTTMVSHATRNVNEAIEDSVLNGVPEIQISGNGVYGLLTAPYAHHYTFKDGEAWTATGHDGQDILDDFLGMVQALMAQKRYGPYLMYVPTAYGFELQQDFKANTTGSVLQRILAINDASAPGSPLVTIKVADQMPADTIVMFQATSDVIDLVMGQTPTVVPWTSIDGFTLFWMVMAIVIPRVKSDLENVSGILIGKPVW